MTDENLRLALREFVVPAPNESARARAWDRARVAFAVAESGTVASEKNASTHALACLRWALPAMAVIVTAIWFIAHAFGGDAVPWNRMLAEMESLFPNHLSAVIERNGTFEVELSENSLGAPGQPVLVEFRRGGHVLRVMGFSGRRVCVDLGGSKTCFEPLITGDGGVVLSGEHFVWNPEHPATLEGFRVKARTIPSA